MNTSLLNVGDKIKWDTMFHETFEGAFVKQEGSTIHAKRADGTPVLIDAIRAYRDTEFTLTCNDALFPANGMKFDEMSQAVKFAAKHCAGQNPKVNGVELEEE